MAGFVDRLAGLRPAILATLAAALVIAGGHGAAVLELETGLSGSTRIDEPCCTTNRPDSRVPRILPPFAPDALVSHLKLFRGPRG